MVYNEIIMKKYVVLILAFILVFIQVVSVTYGQESDNEEQSQEEQSENESQEETENEEDNSAEDEERKNELENQIEEYEVKLQEARERSNTLSSQIGYLDTQMNLTELKIQQTEDEIVRTEEEINTLGTRIEDLDGSMDNLSVLLLNRIVDSYKQREVSVFDVILDSDSANNLVNQYKYLKRIQDNNQKILFQVQKTKSNFEQQKTIRENKKVELDNLQVQLAAQKEDLAVQQSSKQQLLSVTQNDEATYQRLIEEAERQIASFKSFVASTGVGTIAANSLGTGEGGWYMSQRDERWAGQRMGASSESVLDVGCFITSIAMVMKYYGHDYTPTIMSSNPKYFSGGSQSACFPTSYPTAYACIPSRFNGSWPGGKNYKNISRDKITEYVERGVPVIAGVNGSSHYIVIKQKEDENFIMNDPIYGPDLIVSDYYSLSGPYGVFE